MQFDALAALKQLVLRNDHYFVDGEWPVRILCFDERGKTIPWETVFAASPQDSLPSVCPSPGVGYYAHLRLRCPAHEAGSTDETVWEIKGPDWEGRVRVGQSGGLPKFDAHLDRKSFNGERFLRLFGEGN